MQPDNAATRCLYCGAWTLVPKQLRNIPDIHILCIQCSWQAQRQQTALDKASRLSASAAGAGHEAQTADSPATGRTAHTYMNPQAVDNYCG